LFLKDAVTFWPMRLVMQKIWRSKNSVGSRNAKRMCGCWNGPISVLKFDFD
jgi:hypothetical protein